MSDLLDKYTLSFKGKKGDDRDYEFSFKVAKEVKVAFLQVGDLNEIHLSHDPLASKDKYDKNYSIKGNLNIQFVEHSNPGAGKGEGGGELRKPKIIIDNGD